MQSQIKPLAIIKGQIENYETTAKVFKNAGLNTVSVPCDEEHSITIVIVDKDNNLQITKI